jgi:PII-like signaling protein
MRQTTEQVLLRIFIEEGYKYKGKPTYQALLEYLRTHDYAGATAIRGIEGFGRKHKMHTADILELSTDLPIVIEIIETPDKVDQLLAQFELTGMVDGALVTQEKATVCRFSA